MSMTREEAMEILNTALRELNKWLEHTGDANARPYLIQTLEALTILAPEPRKEPPTVEEVGDEDVCWATDEDGDVWSLQTGSFVRAWLGTHGMMPFRYWLPYSALPKGDG